MSVVSIYDQFTQLTQREQQYILLHPTHALIISETKDIAFKETQLRFGINGHNDKSDAFRHCFWSALLTRKIGYDGAREFTTAHESSPTNVPAEKGMDLHNNSVGLNIGKNGGTDKYLSSLCATALAAGKLKVLVK